MFIRGKNKSLHKIKNHLVLKTTEMAYKIDMDSYNISELPNTCKHPIFSVNDEFFEQNRNTLKRVDLLNSNQIDECFRNTEKHDKIYQSHTHNNNTTVNCEITNQSMNEGKDNISNVCTKFDLENSHPNIRNPKNKHSFGLKSVNSVLTKAGKTSMTEIELKNDSKLEKILVDQKSKNIIFHISSNKKGYIFDPQTSKNILEVKNSSGFCLYGDILFVGTSQNVFSYNITTHQKNILQKTRTVPLLSVTGDQGFLAYTQGVALILHNLKTGSEFLHKYHLQNIIFVKYDQFDGMLYTASLDNRIFKLNVLTNQRSFVMDCDFRVLDIQFSSDFIHILTSNDIISFDRCTKLVKFRLLSLDQTFRYAGDYEELNIDYESKYDDLLIQTVTIDSTDTKVTDHYYQQENPGCVKFFYKDTSNQTYTKAKTNSELENQPTEAQISDTTTSSPKNADVNYENKKVKLSPSIRNEVLENSKLPTENTSLSATGQSASVNSIDKNSSVNPSLQQKVVSNKNRGHSTLIYSILDSIQLRSSLLQNIQKNTNHVFYRDDNLFIYRLRHPYLFKSVKMLNKIQKAFAKSKYIITESMCENSNKSSLRVLHTFENRFRLVKSVESRLANASNAVYFQEKIYSISKKTRNLLIDGQVDERFRGVNQVLINYNASKLYIITDDCIFDDDVKLYEHKSRIDSCHLNQLHFFLVSQNEIHILDISTKSIIQTLKIEDFDSIICCDTDLLLKDFSQNVFVFVFDGMKYKVDETQNITEKDPRDSADMDLEN